MEGIFSPKKNLYAIIGPQLPPHTHDNSECIKW